MMESIFLFIRVLSGGIGFRRNGGGGKQVVRDDPISLIVIGLLMYFIRTWIITL